MTDLERSPTLNFRLPALLAGKETRKLNFGRAPRARHSPPGIAEARAVARKEGFTARVRLDLPMPRA